MSVLAEFSVVPLGRGVGLGHIVARVLKIVVESGVSYRVNPMGTVLEGEWDPVMEVIRKCHDEAMKDSDRVITSIKIDDRKGGGGRMEQKIESLEQKLGIKLRR